MLYVCRACHAVVKTKNDIIERFSALRSMAPPVSGTSRPASRPPCSIPALVQSMQSHSLAMARSSPAVATGQSGVRPWVAPRVPSCLPVHRSRPASAPTTATRRCDGKTTGKRLLEQIAASAGARCRFARGLGSLWQARPTSASDPKQTLIWRHASGSFAPHGGRCGQLWHFL